MIDVSKSLSDELVACFGEKIVVSESVSGMVTILVPVKQWVETAQALRDNPRLREEVAAGQPFMPSMGIPASQVNLPPYLPTEPLSAVAKAQ